MISYLLFVYQLCYNILVLLNKQYPTRKNPFSARSENSAILSGPGQKILLSFQSKIRKFRSFSGPAQKIPPSVCELSWSVPKFAATPATDPSSLKWTLQTYVQYSVYVYSKGSCLPPVHQPWWCKGGGPHIKGWGERQSVSLPELSTCRAPDNCTYLFLVTEPLVVIVVILV